MSEHELLCLRSSALNDELAITLRTAVERRAPLPLVKRMYAAFVTLRICLDGSDDFVLRAALNEASRRQREWRDWQRAVAGVVQLTRPSQ
jgi:hypothetical protein